jgi:hypothetical protein
MCFSSKSSGPPKPEPRNVPVDPTSTPAANQTQPNPAVLSSTATQTDPLGQSQLGAAR